MKSLVELLECLLLECGRKDGAPVQRDIETLLHRTKHEGDSFITITLPSFCAEFERALSCGQIASNSFLSFRKTRTGIPAFLQGFLSKVFGPGGSLLEEPSLDCIRHVRQICLFGKKVQRPCSDARYVGASEAYLQCDREVAESIPDRFIDIYKQVSKIVLRTCLNDADGWEEDFLPNHGPGATREHISGNQKWVFRRWHMRLEMAGIKYWRYAKATSWPSYEHLNPLPTFVAPRDEEPVRVVFVPKTLKTPRVIAVEPVCMQYTQQGLARLIMKRVERSSLLRGHVNFRDQGVNQQLAKESSKHDMLASLDLSEASDRVSMAHVNLLLESAPKFREWVMACRSTRAQLPDGRIIDIRKFASMGSALCFPMESLVFFVSIMTSLFYRVGLPVTARLLRSFAEEVYVYGDDLFVPADMAPAICDDLEALGFKVNRRKSFWNGSFRESCGADCYDNEKVTPVYLRRDLPTDRTDVTGLVSTVATTNQLFMAGYTRTADLLRQEICKVFGDFPQVTSGASPAIGWFDHSEVKPRKRWNVHLQRREYLVTVAQPTWTADSIQGNEQALAKCFRRIGNPFIPYDPKHLRESVRPYALVLKRKWVPDY